jgi:hypothetical protein
LEPLTKTGETPENRNGGTGEFDSLFSQFPVAPFPILLVARDGIEPPTPAFSGPLTESPKWFAVNGSHEGKELMPR